MFFFLQTEPLTTTVPTDENGFKVWVIVTLVGAIGAVFGLYIKAKNDTQKSYNLRLQEMQEMYNQRIADRDETIRKLETNVTQLQTEKTQLLIEIKRTLENSSSVLSNVFQTMNVLLKSKS